MTFTAEPGKAAHFGPVEISGNKTVGERVIERQLTFKPGDLYRRSLVQDSQRPNPSGQGFWGWRYASRKQIEESHSGTSTDPDYRKEIYDSDTSVSTWRSVASTVMG